MKSSVLILIRANIMLLLCFTWCSPSLLCWRTDSCRWWWAAACVWARCGCQHRTPDNDGQWGLGSMVTVSKCPQDVTSVVSTGARLTESRPPNMNNFSVWKYFGHGQKNKLQQFYCYNINTSSIMTSDSPPNCHEGFCHEWNNKNTFKVKSSSKKTES